MEVRTYELKALTDIWTGDIDGKPDRLITTGLLGSIRWWFEVVVRGLGGFACDPSNTRCEVSDKGGRIRKKCCVVCEFFGCTGWGRKFRFDVLDENDRPRRKQITKNTTFKLRFTPLRPIRDEEWALLDVTLRLIAGYGAIGGKTVFKPTEQENRKTKDYHRDFGLFRIQQPADGIGSRPRVELERYVQGNHWRNSKHGRFGWASLEHFWCVQEGRTLARQSNQKSTINRVIGRQEPKSRAKQLAKGNDAAARWLAGGTGRSKKVFSFQDPARTFGFVNPQGGKFAINHQEMKERLRKACPDLKDDEYQVGPDVLDTLLAVKGASS